MQIAHATARRLRIAGVGVGALLLALLFACLLLLSFGWGLLRPLAERRLSAALDRRVTIGRIRRIDGLSLHPLLSIEDVRVAQPRWVGGGDMARIRAARVRIALLPLLAGRLRPQVVLLDGARLALVRNAWGKGSWEPEHPRGGPSPDLGQLVVRDATVSLEDRVRDRRFVARVTADARGFRLAGPGSIAGTPATIVLRGPPVTSTAPWPFAAEVRSGVVSATMRGWMRTPLDLGHFDARVTASGRDLRDLDRLIEAGLPATQPFRLTATVHHDQPAWRIAGLAGTIGRSAVTGTLSIDRFEQRVLLKGALSSPAFDFDDLATDAQLRAAAAEARRTGPRIFPDLSINLSKLRGLDGTMKVSIAHIVSPMPTVFRSVTGTLTLDHGVLTLAPLDAGMAAGRLTGSAVIRHQQGRPLLLIDVRLRHSRLERMVRPQAVIAGPLEHHVVLRGRGETVRAAIGAADGRMGFAMRGGEITRQVALFLGADVGRGLFAGKESRTPVTCLVAVFAVSHGIARPAPVVFDTPVARADGAGTITLANERLALAMTGRPKRASLLQLNGPITVGGTLELPTFNPPPQTRTVGGLLKMVGKAFGGHPRPLGADADCAGLAASALR